MANKKTPSTTELIFMILVFGLLTLGIHPIKEQMRRKWVNKINLFTILGLESIILGIIGAGFVLFSQFYAGEGSLFSVVFVFSLFQNQKLMR